MQRRQFIEKSSATALLTGWAAIPSSFGRTAESPADSGQQGSGQQESGQQDGRRVVVGVMGMGRGLALAMELIRMAGVEVRYVCDADSQRAESAAKNVNEKGGNSTPIQDFRRILDDKEVDALFCAAPNHWHGPATVLACKAGKHVYVEKPASHNPQEGEWMVEAASKYARCVQMGTQRRSSVGYLQAIDKLRAGAIGKVYLARGFYNSKRGSIGTRSEGSPPSHLAFDLWQGPAPKRLYRDNVVHYNWHWFWHWGNGELGNNGVHLVDLCRWGLEVDYPVRTISSGGRYRFQDDQETPDTQRVAWEFEGGKQITYEGISCGKHSGGPFISFYGYDGYLEIDSEGGHRVFDTNDKLVDTVPSTGLGQAEHVSNFIESVRVLDPSLLRQPIASAHCSTLLCHLGNIAHRTGHSIETNPANGHLIDASLASKYWGREYDSAWDPLLRMP